MGNMVQHNATENIGNISENGCFVQSRAPCRSHVDPTLGRSCSQTNGSNLGPSCAMLEPGWAQVEARWVQVGPNSCPCWPKLTTSGAHDAAVLDRNGANLQKVTYRLTTVPCTFWRFALANMAPRRSCTRLTDRSVLFAC